MTGTTTQDAYAFSNTDREAVDRHAYLSTILDEFTFSRLSSVGDLAGLRCLEVGAGGGSVARWLAEQVGSTGRVLATDIDVSQLPPDSPYEVLRHDIAAQPVPAGPWDVIHIRLVLIHVPQRQQVLRDLAAALAPGGALVIEDWDATIGNFVLAAPDEDAITLFNEYQAGLVKILTSAGNDSAWGRRVHGAMIDAGLVDVDTVIPRPVLAGRHGGRAAHRRQHRPAARAVPRRRLHRRPAGRADRAGQRPAHGAARTCAVLHDRPPPGSARFRGRPVRGCAWQ